MKKDSIALSKEDMPVRMSYLEAYDAGNMQKNNHTNVCTYAYPNKEQPKL
jgi:hypothetical protein